MLRCVQEVRYQTEYILGTYCCLLQNVAVQDPSKNTNHYMVLGYLFGVTLRDHKHYLRLRKRLPLYPPKKPSHEDYIFTSIR